MDYDVLVATQTHTNIIAALTRRLAKSKVRLILREVSTPSKNLKLQGMAKWLLKTFGQNDLSLCPSGSVCVQWRAG